MNPPTHICALDQISAVWCWGDNGFGQLGDGTRDDHSTATTGVGGLPPVAQLALGADTTCALGTDHSVWCWGSNGGQYGDGTAQGSDVPKQVFPPCVP